MENVTGNCTSTKADNEAKVMEELKKSCQCDSDGERRRMTQSNLEVSQSIRLFFNYLGMTQVMAGDFLLPCIRE